MMCETPGPPEGWLLPLDEPTCPVAAAAVSLCFDLAQSLAERDEEGRKLAERALKVLRENVIVFRQQAGGEPDDDELAEGLITSQDG